MILEIACQRSRSGCRASRRKTYGTFRRWPKTLGHFETLLPTPEGDETPYIQPSHIGAVVAPYCLGVFLRMVACVTPIRAWLPPAWAGATDDQKEGPWSLAVTLCSIAGSLPGCFFTPQSRHSAPERRSEYLPSKTHSQRGKAQRCGLQRFSPECSGQ